MTFTILDNGDHSGTVHVLAPLRFSYSSHGSFYRLFKDKPSNMKYIISMENTQFIDSAALGLLLVLYDHVGKDRHKVALTGCPPNIKRLLNIANFSRLMTIS